MDDLMFDDLSTYLDYSSTDKKESSPELNSFINSPSQTIPTENSSITNLKGLNNENNKNDINHDALHSILANLEQNRKTASTTMMRLSSSTSSVANDDDGEIMTKPEYINPVLLSSSTLPKLPSSLSPKTSAPEGGEATNNNNNNNLFIDTYLENDSMNFNDLLDGFVDRDALLMNEEEDAAGEDVYTSTRRGSELLTPSNMLRKSSIVELPSSTSEHKVDETNLPEDTGLSKALSQYSLNFQTTTKLTKFRNRRQSVHGAMVNKRKPSLESPLTSPSRTLQAFSNSNNNYRLNTHHSASLNNLFSWENAILSDDEEGDRRNNFIASPGTNAINLANASTDNDNKDNDLEIVEPSVNISPVFNPKTLSALDPKFIGDVDSTKSFTAPITLSSRTRASNGPSVTPGSTVSSSTRRRRRSAITPVSSRVSSSSSRRNKSISVELSDGETKPFQCGDCDKAFRRSEHLKRHVRSVHSNERPFPCMFCEKKFSRSDNLSQHLKTHKKHGDF